jgi:hypothetical protein
MNTTTIAVVACAATLLCASAMSDTLITTENQVTSSPLYETTPTLANNGISAYVVYTARELLSNGFFDQGDIWYQTLDAGGVPTGAAVRVSDPSTDDKLNDAFGDYIVCTAYVSTDSGSGTIVVYQVSTGAVYLIAGALVIQEPRIHGNFVVWVQGGFGQSEVMIYDLADLGTSTTAVSLTGTSPPSPPASNVDIGDRFVVWVEQDSDLDIGAHDFNLGGMRLLLTDTNAIDERHPSTSGDWIVWESQDHGATAKEIIAVNPETGDLRFVSDDTSAASRPSMDGDLIAYETNTAGNFDVYVYRISTEETFAVTISAEDQYLNDVYSDMIAYVDMRNGNEDVYVSHLTFIPDDPCADLGGDGDGDGVCDDIDNCPLVANPSQSNSDTDGLGDACDNCPIADNPIQNCSDNTDCIGASNTCLVSTGFCSAQNNNDGDDEGDFCDLDDDNDLIPDVDDNCPLVANEDQADADSDGLGDVCDDTFTNSTVVTEIISAGNAAVEFITNVNPPGGNGLIAKLTGNDGVATKVDAAVSAYEAGTIDEQTYLLELQSALEKLDAFDNQLAGKIRNGQIADPEATELTGLSALIRQAINDLIANASS